MLKQLIASHPTAKKTNPRRTKCELLDKYNITVKKKPLMKATKISDEAMIHSPLLYAIIIIPAYPRGLLQIPCLLNPYCRG